MTRFLAILLTVLMLLGAVSSCTPEGNAPSDETSFASETDGATEPETDPNTDANLLYLIQNGAASCRIVVQNALAKSDQVRVALSTLTQRVESDHGIKMTYMNEVMWSGDVDEPLILVGEVSFFDYSNLKSMLRVGEYWVGVKDGHVLLYGDSEESTVKALNYFTNSIVNPQWKTRGTLTVSQTLAYCGTGSYTMDNVLYQNTELREFQIVIPKDASIALDYTARELRCYFAMRYGYALELVKETATRTAHEIVLDVSADASTYTVRTSEGRIELRADGMFGFESAWSYLRDTLLPACKQADGRTYVLPEGYSHVGDVLEAADDPTSVTQSGDERVMFYNVQGHAPSEQTTVRLQLQLELIRAYAPGVIGFQEFHIWSHTNGFKTGLFEMDYVEVPCVFPSTNTKKNNYTAIFYQASRYTLLDHGYRLYTGKNDSCSKGLQYAVLENRETKKQFCVINTHYWWEWRTPEDMQTRISNSQELLETVATVRASFPNIAIVAGGDFNCGRKEADDNPIYLLEQNGFSHAFHVAEQKDDRYGYIGYNDAFHATYRTFLSCNKPSGNYFPGSIDHALVMGNLTVNNYHRVLDTYALYSSDHAPHFVDLTIG